MSQVITMTPQLTHNGCTDELLDGPVNLPGTKFNVRHIKLGHLRWLGIAPTYQTGDNKLAKETSNSVQYYTRLRSLWKLGGVESMVSQFRGKSSPR